MKLKVLSETYPPLLLIGLVYIFHLFFFGNWKTNILSEGDASGYYLYLPSALIHRDLGNLEKTMKVKQEYSNHSIKWPSYKFEDGKFINQYTAGVAILNSIPFSIAHGISKLTGMNPDGYSAIYRIAIHLFSILFVLSGFWFIGQFIKNYFAANIVSIGLLCIAFGTNLFYVESLNGGMAHGYLFTLHAALIYFTYQYAQKQTSIHAFIAAFICGFIVLIRPDEIIVLLVPLFLFSSNLKSLIQHPKQILLSLTGFIIPILPQLIYWKVFTGSWIYYSYGDQGFDFLHPNIIDGLFSFKNGWLVYTPIMILSLAGLILGFRKYTRQSLLFSLILLIHIYIIYSWWCWNYINGFGSRPMVEYYAILAFPLVVFLDWIKDKRGLSWLAGIFIICCIAINIMHTHQINAGILFTEDASKGFYLSSFGKFKLEEADLIANDINQLTPADLKFVETLGTMKFDKSSDSFKLISKSGKDFFETGNGVEFSPGIDLSFNKAQISKGDYLKLSSIVFTSEYAASLYEMAKLVLQIKSSSGELKEWVGIKVQDKLNTDSFNIFGGQKDLIKEIGFSYRLENHLLPGDHLQVYIWNPYNTKVYVHNFQLQHLKK